MSTCSSSAGLPHHLCLLIGCRAHEVKSEVVTPGLPISRVIDRLRAPGGQKLVRYSVASIVAVVVSEICLVMFNGVIGISAWVSSSLATAIAAVPNYYMNRRWAWGKHGRSHLLKEVAPFWGLAVLGWTLSTYSVYLMERYAKHHHFAHIWTTASVAVVYIGAFGVLWIAKFIIFNKLMFVHPRHQQDDDSQGVAAAAGEPAGVRIPG